MKNLKHPAVILVIIAIITLFIGIGLRGSGDNRTGDILIIIAAILGGIHWIWGVMEVIGRSDLKPFQKRFWLIIVIACPVLGALLFFSMHQAPNKIVT